jgi:hypothetical protein
MSLLSAPDVRVAKPAALNCEDVIVARKSGLPEALANLTRVPGIFVVGWQQPSADCFRIPMSTSRLFVCLRCALLFLLLAPVAGVAQWTSNALLTDDQLWEFGGWGAEAVGKTAGQAFGGTQITMAGFHLGRVIHRASPDSGLRRTWEYTLELEPLFLVTRLQRVYGGGFAPVGLKWNFAPRGRYRPYLEFNGGAMFTQKNVPSGNTSTFNFTAALGPGVMIAVTRTQAMSFAVRAWHLSNAYIGAENPSFNTVQFVVGYHWLVGREEHRQLSGVPAGASAKE